MLYYDSAAIYINSAASQQARLANINAVLTALYAQRLATALNDTKANVSEYSLDDGQTKIKTVYRNLDQINNAIHTLERERQTVYNQLNGRMTRLRDQRNFRNGCY